MIKLTQLSLYFISIFSFSQTNYYVSKNGNNNNSGSEAQPFASIEKAIDIIGNNGGTCIIKGGTYHEEITLDNKDNITIRAYDNEHVVIDGTIEVNSSWLQSPHKSAIYETTLTQDIWQLFIDDEQQVPARWPNAQFNDDSVFDRENWSTSENLDAAGLITDTENLATSGINMEGALAIANFGSWKTSVLNVLTHSGNTMTYDTNELNGTYIKKHHYYYLENKLEFLDVANEWFYDVNTKKLYVYGNPSGKKIQAKTQSYAFTMNNCTNLTFENLNFFSTTITSTASYNITVNNCLFSYPSCSKRMLGSIASPESTKLEVNNNNNATHFKFHQCLFEHTDGEALVLKGSENTIEDCYFHHIDYSCGNIGGIGVSIKNNGNQINFKQNTMHTTGASETLDLGMAPKVSYNNISKTGFLQNDGSIVQVTKKNVTGSEIHHNWFHNSIKTGMRYDAVISTPWQAGTGGLVHHNIMWNLTISLVVKGNSQEIYNNTCFDNEKIDIPIIDENYLDPQYAVEWAAAGNAIPSEQPSYTSSNTFTVTRNNAADKISGHRKNPQAIPGTSSHNTYSSTSTDYGIKALLEDPDNYDFRPKVGSVLIDAGVVISGITDGYTGSAPDVGAYERTDTWTAGVTWEPDFYPWSFLSLGVDKEKQEKIQLQIYPNPATESIKLKIPNQKINKVTLYNMVGKEVIHLHKSSIEKVPISQLENGVYFLTCETLKGLRASSKIIIQH